MLDNLILLIFCSFLSHIMAGTMTVISDTSVYTIINSQTIYATNPANYSYAWKSIDGASWIWYASDNTKIEAALFIKCFSVPGTPTSSNINIGADDNFTVFLNGRLVGMKSLTSFFLTEIDMLSKTVYGQNCLHIIVENTVDYAGLIFKATISYQ
ncbi:unnamed protein product [Blepharisma stoltei]|uniref:Uncharacterized protein n=1 Tax=Blepharisma stoltei TaxID=1481888 RepID=A0AAU9ISK2_9CILI|nr:unnamed protein product [Blepharisma stoltei]